MVSSSSAASPGSVSGTDISLREEVNAIISSGRTKYDAAHLCTLSKYLNEQISCNTYDFNSNLTILHIYTLYPQCFDFDVCRKILIKGLMNLPNIDFAQYLYLIPESKAKDVRIGSIIKFNDNLQACKFKHAWEELKEPLPNLLNELYTTPNFVECLRMYIGDIISATFTAINLNDIMGLLNFSNVQEFEKFARSYGWVVNAEDSSGRGGGGSVIINAKSDEQSGVSTNGANTNKQANKQIASNLSTAQQRINEKYMNIDSIKTCFATLQR